MENPRQVFKKALQDPKILRLTCFTPKNFYILENIIKKRKDDFYISEWKHNINGKYEYHIHTNGILKDLKRLYNNNICGGNPKLIGIYSKNKLKQLINK